MKRARVIESDEDEDTLPVAAQRLSQLKKIQEQKEKIDKLEAENRDLKTNVVDPCEIDALKEEIAKLQAENKELTKASEARGSNQNIERRKDVSNTSDQGSQIEMKDDNEIPTISSNPDTLSGKASVLEQRLEVAKEKVAAKSRLYQEAKSHYEKAQVEHRTLTKKRE